MDFNNVLAVMFILFFHMAIAFVVNEVKPL